ncbi:MAG: hypothetical protein V1721_03215 [Pseudomonadota bacterium]
MPIVVVRKDEDKGVVVNSVRSTDDGGQFDDEDKLQSLLEKYPNLVREDHGPEVNLVKRELILPKAGKLDLLFVDSDGLPIAVEVKLDRNAKKREVVAQALDYLTDLTSLTVDELDQLVNKELTRALEQHDLAAEGEKDPDFLWNAVGRNLRAGKARLMVVMDRPHPDLERIFSFLANNSQLDVQLLMSP